MWKWIIITAPLAWLGLFICKLFNDKDTVKYTGISLPKLIIKLVFRFFRHPFQGNLRLPRDLIYVAGGDVSPDCSLKVSPTNHKVTAYGIRIDKKNLAEYKKLCGYQEDSESKTLPPCYAETLLLKPLVVLITSSKFCLSPVGLIHLRQTITQYKVIHDFLDSELKAEVEVKAYRQYDRGVECDIQLRLLGGASVCLWEGMITLLSRNMSAKSRPRKPRENMESTFNAELPIWKEVSVPGNCGLKYARLAGDWNPHHLYPWSAQLLGYNKPIAHGMWTLSRALAEIGRYADLCTDDNIHITCGFKRPLLMPGSIFVKMDVPTNLHRAAATIRVEDRETFVPHCIATLKLT